ncbi:zinc-binding alcohol dehydrogenase [Candidatus Sumerlaeota bacterium]|nr:zinc-binding alcohol dehydrogenase [Candidatus Sumerlaeota bacterium]
MTMKSLYANGRGAAFDAEVPEPKPFDRAVRVRVTDTLVSAGTERGIILNAKYNSDDQAIAAGCTLGYTGAGVVEEVYPQTDSRLKVGDRVACYGAPYTHHAQYLVVPQNLCYCIPDTLSSEKATFAGLGAIAMHGFRMGECQLGSVCVVIGAGIIGILATQMALAAGSRVICSDLATDRLERLRQCVPQDADLICTTPDKLEAVTSDLTRGIGADTVLLCLATNRSEPMEQAIRIGRMRAKVVLIGLLDIKFGREIFFARETEFSCSRAAGDGRYDPIYEHDGIDYPFHIARWTEGRNLEESLRLIARGTLQVEPLIGHRWAIADYAKAYDQIVNGKTDLGHIFKW